MNDLMQSLRAAGFLSRQNAWLALGFTAQIMFAGRFLIQWLASERRGSSIIPVSFWYMSIGGSSLLFVYAVHLRDPVFILGQSMGLVVYVRNLVLIRRQARRAVPGGEGEG